jgi:plastocyanin/mono/diheme cytochrome c family protein
MIDPGQAVVGIIVLLIAVGGLLYLFYSRTNAVEKTGYGALIMLAIVSLMIPVFWILESNGEAMAKAEQHKIAVQRGATLYAQYCFQCHGTRGQGRVGPKLNGNPAVNKLSDADLLRIINGGIYNTDVTQLDKPVMPAWSQDYGGPLTNNDIQYLFELIRSSDPDYLAKNGYQGDSAINGFTLVEALEQANSANAYATAKAQETSGQFGTAKDLTAQKAITINIIASPAGSTCQPACFELLNVKVKVGTVITWNNKDPVAHTVTAIKGSNVDTPVPAKNIFDSGNLPSSATYQYTVSMDAYNLNPNHTVIYFCQYHPSMLAELTIVP